jgi:hypothetical protein
LQWLKRSLQLQPLITLFGHHSDTDSGASWTYTGAQLCSLLCASGRRICPFLAASGFFSQPHHRVSQLCLPVASLTVHNRSLVSCYEVRFSVLFIELQDKGCLMPWLERSLTTWCSCHALTYT